jgi:hypothetical protein
MTTVSDKLETDRSAEKEDDITPEAVREELQQIIASRYFRSSKRSRQFLEYVVDQKLLGNEALIKERLIGIEVFGRDIDYATGEDPVVRVQAGEVRRRLELYRAEAHETSRIVVDLPTGTYVPVFHSRQIPAPSGPEPATALPPATTMSVVVAAQASVPSLPPTASRTVLVLPRTGGRLQWSVKSAALVLFLLVLGGLAGYLIRTPQHTSDAVTMFWGPILTSPKPILISLGKPFVYAPSARLFDQYATDHPGAFKNSVDRHNQHLPLDGKTHLQWSDMVPVANSGPAVGGVRAALALTAFLGKTGTPFNVRFGDEGSFLELRNSPAVVVGALNNRWTNAMDDDFHFGIRDNNSYQYIVEKGTNRTWRTEYSARGARDYGLITRQPIGSTGQFLLKIAGMSDGGTEAACELVTNPETLQHVVHSLPPHWETKNLQILVATNMIGGNAGPPQVVAIYAW